MGQDDRKRPCGSSIGTVQRSYGYNAAGYLTTQSDTTSAGTSKSAYAYDEAGQLISYTPPSGPTWVFTYDTNGNRRSGTSSNGPSTYAYAANSNRLTSANSASYSYNADGTVKTMGQESLTYDMYGRLATFYVPNLLSNTYAYNGLAQRAFQTSSMYGTCSLSTKSPYESGIVANIPCSPHWTAPSTTSFVYDPQSHLLGEYSSGYSQETVWFNGQPVATVQGGTIYYVNDDNLGTPRSVVRASDNAEVWRWDSEPFGGANPTGSLTYNLRFPGQIRADSSGFYYNGMRDYDSTTGRYIEPDPLKLGGGLARYTYAGGNPMNQTDPMGLFGVAVSTGGDVAVFVGAGAWSGLYYSPDGDGFGSFTTNSSDYGLASGVGGQVTAFFGSGTDLFSGASTSYSISVFDLSLGITFGSSWNVGFFGLTSASVGLSRGLPIGAVVGNTQTTCH